MKQNRLLMSVAGLAALCAVSAATLSERPLPGRDRPQGENVRTQLPYKNAPKFMDSSMQSPTAANVTRGKAPRQIATGDAARQITLGGGLHYSLAWTDWAHYGLYSFTTAPDGGDNVDLISEYWFFNTGNGAVYDNALHVVDYSQYGDDLYVNYNKIDLATGSYVDYASFNDLSLYPYDCDYDPVTTGVVGCFVNAENTAVQLAFVDYDTRYRKAICELPDILYCVAVNSKGEIFGIDGTGMLRQYSRTDGAATDIMDTGLTPMYMQSATFDRVTDKMYWAYTNGNTSALYEIDTEAPSITKIFDFANCEEFTTLYVEEPVNFAAPASPSDFNVSFGADNNGEVSFTLPSNTREGNPISGELSYTLLANGASVVEGTAKAGESVTKPVTVEYGENLFVLTCSNGEGASAPVKYMKWVGYGETLSPSNLAYNVAGSDITVSWDAPYSSILDAYFVPEELTYTVTRYPEGKVVADKISEKSFTETLEVENPLVVWYGVTADNHGFASQEALTAKFPVGDAFTTPYYEDFENPDNFNLFTVLDNNHDGRVWMVGLHQGFNPTGFAFCNTNKYGLQGIEFSDDWLLTPQIRLSKDEIYEFNFIAWTMFSRDELMEVAFGQGEDPTDADKYEIIVEKTIVNTPYETPNFYKYLFIPKADGNYRVAFHGVTGLNGSAFNIDELNLFSIGQAAAPAMVENLKAVPFAEGATGVTVSFDTPALNAAGTGNHSGITAVELFRGNEVINQWDAQSAGAHLEFADNTPSEGKNVYRVVCHSAEGQGHYAETSAFVGCDTPVKPAAFKAYDEGDVVTLSWENPGYVGSNGGYVNADNLTYELYNVQSYYAEPFKSGLGETSYVIEKANEGDQTLAYYGVAAYDGATPGDIAVSNHVMLGKPHALPFVETFCLAKYDNSGWWEVGDIEHIFYTYADISSDEGSTAVAWAPEMGYTETWLNSGKIDISNAVNPMLMFDWMANPNMNARLDVYVVEGGCNETLVNSIDFSKNSDAKAWRTAVVSLDQFKGSKSVMLKFYATGKDYGQQICLDRIQVRNILDKDLMATLAAPKRMIAGKANEVTVKVDNNSEKAAEGYTVNLYLNDELYASEEGKAINGLGVAEYKFGVVPAVLGKRACTLKAEVVTEGDQDASNNMSATADVQVVFPEELPTPKDLKVEQNDGNASLSWTAPVIVRERVEDMFEYYDNGDLTFGDWKTYDFDKGLACGINGCEIPHWKEPISFMVFNPEETGIDIQTRSQFEAYSGEQYLITQYGYYGAPNSDDWLISPELDGSAQTITMYIAMCADYYNETFEIWYSETDTEVESFKLLKQDKVRQALWDEYNYDLPEGAKYFALRYTAREFMIMVDDISYYPALPVLSGYKLYCNGVLMAEIGKDATTYEVAVEKGIDNKYAVTAVYESGESMPSNDAVVTGVGSVNAGEAAIAGQKGMIILRNLAGENVNIHSLDGKLLYSGDVKGNAVSIPMLPGSYTVKAGSSVKVVIVE